MGMIHAKCMMLRERTISVEAKKPQLPDLSRRMTEKWQRLHDLSIRAPMVKGLPVQLARMPRRQANLT